MLFMSFMVHFSGIGDLSVIEYRPIRKQDLLFMSFMVRFSGIGDLSVIEYRPIQKQDLPGVVQLCEAQGWSSYPEAPDRPDRRACRGPGLREPDLGAGAGRCRA